MHELSVCQGLFAQARQIARKNGASGIERIAVEIGPLSGVEPDLLARAFEIARIEAGYPQAVLDIEVPPLVVDCPECGTQSEVGPSDLSCRTCGNWRVKVISGTEMILKSIDLSVDMPDGAPADATIN